MLSMTLRLCFTIAASLATNDTIVCLKVTCLLSTDNSLCKDNNKHCTLCTCNNSCRFSDNGTSTWMCNPHSNQLWSLRNSNCTSCRIQFVCINLHSSSVHTEVVRNIATLNHESQSPCQGSVLLKGCSMTKWNGNRFAIILTVQLLQERRPQRHLLSMCLKTLALLTEVDRG